MGHNHSLKQRITSRSITKKGTSCCSLKSTLKNSLPPPQRVQLLKAAFRVVTRSEGHHDHADFIIDSYFFDGWFGVFLFH
jgi:hypothetical protein